MPNCGGEQGWKTIQSLEGPNHHLGDSEEGIERSIPFHQHCLGGQGSVEKAQTHRICDGLCQGIQFLDAGHKEHVRGGQTFQFHIWIARRPSQKETGRLRLRARLLRSCVEETEQEDCCRGKPVEKTTKFVQQTTRMAGCFICNDPHRAKDCPKRKKLSALVTADDKGESDSETPPRVNPLQLLNVKALVDSGATHNFVATREATKLGLKLEEDTSRIKAVNSKA
ncbi:hypothetical protein CK203_077926 [Vitis vinifera]|uniref:Uncharacterized protein n=1 Tax=Vitis vinifera TaxID=29760 RepID=A0A438EBM2_VITVI|nr:hypothetical protein CK203_077926 [Vitis vinifera]